MILGLSKAVKPAQNNIDRRGIFVDKVNKLDIFFVDIFNKAESTLIKHGYLSKNSRDEAIGEQKTQLNSFRTFTDDEFYFQLAMVIFYSGFKASTVTNKKSSIKKYFASIAKASKYTDKDINDILSDKSIIRNKIKIKSLVKNAKQMLIIQKEFGNFRNYIVSYNKQFPLSECNLNNLKENLQQRFAYLGPATVNHFLTDFAFPVIKPDRMVMRVLYRSHLLKNEYESEFEYAIQIGRRIANLLGIPIRYVDTVLVMLGQVGEANICRKSNPRCNICDLKTICNFNREHE